MPAVNIKGMHCDHCKKAVTEAIAKVSGVASVSVDLQKGEAVWTDVAGSPADAEQVKNAVRRVGFEA